MTISTTHNNEAKKLLRQAFGAFATGVTVVTAQSLDGQPLGFTANSFTSVSLDPAILLVCIAKSSSNYENFTQAKAFAVNILGDDQKDISGRFASKEVDRFANTQWREGQTKAPLMEGVVAWFDCNMHEVIDAGDHAIMLGKIVEFGQNDKRPLAYLRGHYLDLSLAEQAANSVSNNGGVRVGCVLQNLGRIVLKATEGGWTLPMGDVCSSFRNSRLSLEKILKSNHIPAEIGFLYSVFDAPTKDSTWMIFQGEMEEAPATKDYKVFALDEIPLDEIVIPEFRSILRRFQMEFKEARFGLYVDDSLTSGRINQIDSSAQGFSNFMKEKAR